MSVGDFDQNYWTSSTSSNNTNYYTYNVLPQSEPMVFYGDNVTFPTIIGESVEKKFKEALLVQVLDELMNEIILRKYVISEGLKYKILSLLKEIDDMEEKEDNGFIKEEEMLI